MTNENTTRTPGKYGRRPPTNKPAIELAHILKATPPAPTSEDWLARLTDWQMLGNDQYGDCVAVTWANVRRVMTNGKTYPTLTQVEAFYKTQNPNFPSEDNGMDIQTALEDLVKNGGPDGVKAVAFAKVDHTNPSEVQAAIAIFGYVWTGINVQNQNMTEFNAGEAWTWQTGGSIDGGHSIVTGGYGTGGTGQLSGDEKFITWAQETSFTDGFWTHGVEEAWVVVWPEHLESDEFLVGVDVAQLAADYTALTGKTIPNLPTPPPAPPTPPPTPTPTPTPDVPSILRRLIAYLERVLKELGA